jgi:membrane protein YdbS with pleckstrin-like domain
MAATADDLEQTGDRWRLPFRDDATRWVWVVYGLAQAVITMLMAFDVIETLTATEVVTAVTLVVYVAVNELFVRPRRRKPTADATPAP